MSGFVRSPLGVALLLIGGVAAQDADFVSLRENKLQAAFLANGDWATDFDDARDRARRSGKVIFAYFTRSFAVCPACLRLESGALSTPEFRSFAGDVVPFCHVTSHVEDEPHGDLHDTLGGEGWPYLAFLDPDGSLLAKIAAPYTVSRFASSLAAVAVLRQQSPAAKAGDAVAALRVLEAELRLDSLSAAEAAARLASLRGALARDQLAGVEVDVEFLELLEGMPSRRRDGVLRKVGPRLAAIHAAGQVPTTRTREFWDLLVAWAGLAQDRRLLLAAAKAWRPMLDAASARDRRILERLDRVIAGG
ncbi:MAG: hypothetical protein AAF628_05100 [Planctomycetota bacterium]